MDKPLHGLQADALAPLAPGPQIRLANGALRVEVAPQAGGRIASIVRRGVEQLVGYGSTSTSMIGWGCYPMLPWAGRVRDARFKLGAREVRLPPNLGAHAIHGFGFAMPWQVEACDGNTLQLSLALPQDERWPFGGTAAQHIQLGADRLELGLSVRAGALPMPVVIGWHPWFRKPRHLGFFPQSIYPRDRDGIATLPVAEPPAGPWDDCFINTRPVSLDYDGFQLHLSSDCTHWIVFDQTDVAACVEPQSGPPDAFNIEPFVLQPGESLQRWFHLQWNDN